MSENAKSNFRKLKRLQKREDNLVYTNPFSFGTLAMVHDSKVHFFGDSSNRRDFYHDSERPGVVVEQLPPTNTGDVLWVPGSTKLKSRDQKTTVVLSPENDSVNKSTVLLLIHKQWYRPVTVTSKNKSISLLKQDELKHKLKKLPEQI